MRLQYFEPYGQSLHVLPTVLFLDYSFTKSSSHSLLLTKRIRELHYRAQTHRPSSHFRKYLLGLALEFVDGLVPAEAHSDFKLRKNRFHDVLNTISSSESEAIHVWSSH